MAHVDSQTVKCHLGGCLTAVATDASENIGPEQGHITRSVKTVVARTVTADFWAVKKDGQKERVHNVHTLGFGSSRMSAGLGRIAEVFGGAAEIQGLESGSSPTSGTYFPCSGAFWCFFVWTVSTLSPLI